MPEEKAIIQNMANTARLSVAEYLRRVGMSCPISVPFGRENLAQLSRVNGDLGRLGGLLKLWLTDSEKNVGMVGDIRTLLGDIEANQQRMKDILAKLV